MCLCYIYTGFMAFSSWQILKFQGYRLLDSLEKVVPKTKGVKVPMSTFKNICWYFLFFSSVFLCFQLLITDKCKHLSDTLINGWSWPTG